MFHLLFLAIFLMVTLGFKISTLYLNTTVWINANLTAIAYIRLAPI